MDASPLCFLSTWAYNSVEGPTIGPGKVCLSLHYAGNSSKAGMCLRHFYLQAGAVCGPDWPLSIHLSKEREPTLGITVTVLTLRAVTVLNIILK